MKPKAECQHEKFQAKVGVHRLTETEGGPVTGYTADVEIYCAECGTRFQFLGLEPGMQMRGVSVSLDGLEARLALCPEGSEPNPFEQMGGHSIIPKH